MPIPEKTFSNWNKFIGKLLLFLFGTVDLFYWPFSSYIAEKEKRLKGTTQMTDLIKVQNFQCFEIL